MTGKHPINEKAMVLLQEGIPIERRPFAGLGESIGVAEMAMIEQMLLLFDIGKAHRFGATFDSRRLGYKSTLCAVTLDEASLMAASMKLLPLTGVTHCYLRGWPDELDKALPGSPGNRNAPNTWFVFVGPHDSFDAELDKIRKALAPAELHCFPACRRFKIDEVFDPTERKTGESFPGASSSAAESSESPEAFHTFTDEEKEIVRILQGNFRPGVDFFKEVADMLSMDPDKLVTILKEWKEEGILRKLSLFMRDREVGMGANAMCVWNVPDDQITDKGRALSEHPAAFHCYERKPAEGFPFNLFTMIHASDFATAQTLFEELSHCTGLDNGMILCSLTQYKKTVMKYFV